MSFLKKLGIEILKIAGVVSGMLPMTALLDPTHAAQIQKLSSGLHKFFAIVQDVEAAGSAISAPGPDKLKMATPLVAQEILKILDELGFEVDSELQPRLIAVATGYASVTADLLNIIKKK